MRKTAACIVASALFAAGCGAAAKDAGGGGEGDAFPSKTVTIVVPYDPGAGGDTMTRILQPYLEKELGQTVVIENKGGAGGIVGTADAVQRPADGYTIIMWAPPVSELNAVAEDTGYEVADFAGLGASTPDDYLMISAASKSWKSLQELIDEAKGGHTVTIGGTGPFGGGGISYLRIVDALGIEAQWVPFGSTAEVKAAALGGQIDVGLTGDDGSFLDMKKAGKINILAILGKEARGKLVDADVPTFESVTGEPVYFGTTRGHVVRSDIPAEHLATLREAYAAASKNPEFIKEIETKMGTYGYTDGETLTKEMQANADEFADMVPRLKELAG